MFPTPIQKYSLSINVMYRVALIVTLFIWLMPLIAVMLTSIRTYDDILAGNYWGWPKEIAAIENYSAIFEDGRMARLNDLIKFSKTKQSPISINLIISDNAKAKGLKLGKINKIKKKVFNFRKKYKFENQILYLVILKRMFHQAIQ